MPKISGDLLFVSSRAAQVSEVWVRASGWLLSVHRVEN